MFNSHGDVVRLGNTTYHYDAFGNEIPSYLIRTDTNPFRYCGEYYDSETRTYYLRAKYYNPRNGRFTTEDTHWNVGNMIYGDNPTTVTLSVKAKRSFAGTKLIKVKIIAV